MIRLSAATIILTLATVLATFTLLNRNYARALEQCERIHSRETCIHILR
jgi:hypothetical protein